MKQLTAAECYLIRAMSSNEEPLSRAGCDQQHEELFGRARKTAAVGLWVWDKLADTVSLDERAVEILQNEGPIAQPAATAGRLIHQEDSERVRRTFRRMAEDLRPFSDLEFRLAHSTYPTWLSANGEPVLNETGELVAVAGSLLDITRRHGLQEQLLVAQKMEAMGQLTAGISHNFNNILSAILPNLNLAARSTDEKGASYLRSAQLAAERASELISELMLVAGRRETETRRPVDLVETVKRVVRICQTTFGNWIQLSLSVRGQIPAVLANEGQLEQILLNLLLNARDAFEDAATACPNVEISVQGSDASDSERNVFLRIQDNGPGMNDETRQRVFEPFFTTKGGGTGLGLATAYAIANEHGGRISCSSTPGEGTSFDLALPAARGSAVHRTTVIRNSEQGGTESIAVVDDDPLVRKVAAETLREAGYNVIEFANGPSCIEHLRDGGGDCDLLILDIAMPEMTGDVVIGHVRELRPDQRILVFTGVAGQRLWELDDVEILRKPAGVAELLSSVRRVLDAPRLRAVPKPA
jgi:signal transduction histidine kinase